MGRGARLVVVGVLLVASIAVTGMPASSSPASTDTAAFLEGAAPVPAAESDESGGGAAASEAGIRPWFPFAVTYLPTGNASAACLIEPPGSLTSTLCPGPDSGNFGSQNVFRPTAGLCARSERAETIRDTIAIGPDHELHAFSFNPNITSPNNVHSAAVVEDDDWCAAMPYASPNALVPNTGANIAVTSYVNGLLRGQHTYDDGGKGRLTRYPGGVGYPGDEFPEVVGWDNATFTLKGQHHTNIDNRGLWEFIGTSGRSFGGGWARPWLINTNAPTEQSAAVHTWNLQGSDLPGICDPSNVVYSEVYDADGPGPGTVQASRSWTWSYSRMLHCLYAIDTSGATEIVFNRKTIDPTPVVDGGRYDIELSPRFGWVPESWRNLNTWVSGASNAWEVKRFRPMFANDLIFSTGAGDCIWRAGEGRIGTSAVCNDSAIQMRSITALLFDTLDGASGEPTMLPAEVLHRYDVPGQIVVTTTADVVDATPGNGICGPNFSTACSLRAAIQEANGRTGPDEIVVPSGTYDLTIAGAGEDDGATGDLDVTDELTITAAGEGEVVIDANGIDRVLHVPADLGTASLAIEGLTVTGGDASEDGGGGLLVRGADLTVSDSTIIGNDASIGGGGIAFDGDTLRIDRSTIEGNGAESTGGGLWIEGLGPASALDLVVATSTISSNVAGDAGGGIYYVGPGNLLVDTSTVSGNSAASGGGIAIGGGRMRHRYSTIAMNSGGGIERLPFLVDPPAALDGVPFIDEGSVLGPQLTGPDCADDFLVSAGSNADSDDTCNLDQVDDLPGVEPLLGPLADNGGPTLTHAPRRSSPLIDASATCTGLEDQRGVARPQGTGCDIGAVELEPATGVAGRVVEDSTGVPLAGITVRLLSGGSVADEAITELDGTFWFDGVAPGDYGLRYIDPTGVHRTELFDDAPTSATADTVPVVADDVAVADASLALVGATVKGKVKQQGSGVNLAGISVRLLTTGNVLVGARTTGADGRYSFADVPAADYVVRFIDLDGSHVTEYHLDASSFGGATAVATSVGATTTVDAQLASTSTGDVVGSVLEEGSGVPLVGVSVRLLNEGNVLVGARTVQADGSFTFFDVVPGSYRVRFVDGDGSHVTEYHLDAATFSAATPVGVTASTTTTVDATLTPT